MKRYGLLSSIRLIRWPAILIGLLLMSGPSWSQNAPFRTATFGVTVPGPEAVVNAAAHYVDEIFAQTLTALQVVADTPEARARDWEGVRGYLVRIEARLPGAYFLLEPDGGYYTLADGRTTHNLSDRPYFAPLFGGTPVRAFPLLSRSTGRKAAVLAIPVVAEGRVVAAVGAAVFLDELRARLNRELALPASYTWFVLDAQGNTLLDRDGEFILMNALQQGSPSMKEAVARALLQQHGSIRYTLDGTREAVFRKLPTLEAWMFLARTEERVVEVPAAHGEALAELTEKLQAELYVIDSALAEAARTLGHTGLGEVQAALRAVLSASGSVADVAFIDSGGVLRAIAPDRYAPAVGADLNEQAHVRAMRTRPVPIFSEVFRPVEGGLAVSVMRPVHDAGGVFLGALSALVRPAALVERVHGPAAPDDGRELWLMQPDGLILYDEDEDEIGRLLFSDPGYANYASLLALGRRIAEQHAGTGSYVFPAAHSMTEVVKHGAWQSLRLHGREWRVVLTYRPFAAQ